MDPAASKYRRPLIDASPEPTLFNLVDDMAHVLLREYLGLVPGASGNHFFRRSGAMLTLVRLRLVNRETYCYLERWGFPALAAVPSILSNVPLKRNENIRRWGLTVSYPWYRFPKVVKKAIRTHVAFKPFDDPAFWDLFHRDNRLKSFFDIALHYRNFRVADALIQTDEGKCNLSWKKLALRYDNPDYYAKLEPGPIRWAHETSMVLKFDAAHCLEVMLARERSEYHQWIISNLRRRVDAFGVDSVPKIHALVTALLPAENPKKRPRDEGEEEQNLQPSKRPRLTDSVYY
jgi:hypothetical protein